MEVKREYLAATAMIDWQHPQVVEKAAELAALRRDRLALAERSFLFVRDAIDHSFDVGAEAVTGSASEVLQAGHGICYAKSHLLAALLRANGIPAGLGYQRLADDEGGFVLHGYTTVWLEDYGWYCIDARGNVGGVNAQFTPPRQRLAFSADGKGEVDYNLNLAEPLPCIVRCLQRAGDCTELSRTLPSSVPMG